MITGTIINAAAIITGGLIGVIINKGIPVRVSNIIFQALGLFSVFLGVSLAFKTQNNYLIFKCISKLVLKVDSVFLL